MLNICSLQNWGLVCWEATSDVKSGVLCHSSSAQCSCARVMRWKAKVSSSLTDVWQRLFEQQDITVIVLCTIHSHPGCMKTTPDQCTSTWRYHWNRHTGTCLSETSEGRQWAEAACDWNVVSYQQSFIDQATEQWQDCFNVCFKAKSKHRTFAQCFSVTVTNFKAS